MRLYLVIAGALLISYGGARLLAEFAFHHDPSVEPRLCRSGLCGNDYLLPVAHQQHWEGGPESAAAAVADFREMLRRDPASPFRWCDLGEALLDSGELAPAKYCFSRALELGGASPFIRLRAANFEFRLGETRAALGHTSRILMSAPQFDPVIFGSYSRLARGVPEVLAYGLPEDRRAGQAYFRYLLGLDNLSDAEAAWEWVRGHGFDDGPLASEYVNFLLGHHSFDAAARAWGAHLRGGGDYPKPNAIFNGGFEIPPTGGRLDWTVTPVKGAQAVLDAPEAFSGQRCLRIVFSGKDNVDFSHVSQTAVLAPGRYRLQAWVRTAGITTDQGVGLRVGDAATEMLTGTNDWRRVEKTFSVSGETRLVQVEVVRRPSWKFDNQIAGTVWIDAVSLTREAR
jgi:hypothetical protein